MFTADGSFPVDVGEIEVLAHQRRDWFMSQNLVMSLKTGLVHELKAIMELEDVKNELGQDDKAIRRIWLKKIFNRVKDEAEMVSLEIEECVTLVYMDDSMNDELAIIDWPNLPRRRGQVTPLIFHCESSMESEVTVYCCFNQCTPLDYASLPLSLHGLEAGEHDSLTGTTTLSSTLF